MPYLGFGLRIAPVHSLRLVWPCSTHWVGWLCVDAEGCRGMPKTARGENEWPESNSHRQVPVRALQRNTGEPERRSSVREASNLGGLISENDCHHRHSQVVAASDFGSARRTIPRQLRALLYSCLPKADSAPR